MLGEPDDDTGAITRPADHLENSRLLSWLIGVRRRSPAWSQYFVGGGGLTLNVVNFLFLILAIILHGTPRRLLVALNEAVQGGAGIVIQFPFYAGIMAIMVASGLAATISNWLVSFATAETLPFWTFLSAGHRQLLRALGRRAVGGAGAGDPAGGRGARRRHGRAPRWRWPGATPGPT